MGLNNKPTSYTQLILMRDGSEQDKETLRHYIRRTREKKITDEN